MPLSDYFGWAGLTVIALLLVAGMIALPVIAWRDGYKGVATIAAVASAAVGAIVAAAVLASMGL